MLDGAASGNLCLTASWPGQMRTVWGDHKRFFETYFTTYRGNYFTGDGCRRDEDGYYWITGRVDDVINVSGHRVGSAEVESSLVSHPKVAEAAVVGFPHDIKGQAIYAFVTLNAGEEGDDELRKELVQEVRNDIGALAAPEKIQFTPALPKTRSGKIMRRILRKIAEGETGGFGDTSTLADPGVVDALLAGPPVSVLVALLLAAAAPAHAAFNPVDFFRGRTHGDGTLKVIFQHSKQISVDSVGRSEKRWLAAARAGHPRAGQAAAHPLLAAAADRAQPLRRHAN